VCLKTLGNNPPEICPNNVLLKIKPWLIEARYQQQSAFNVLLPKKNTPKTTIWGRFQFLQRISVCSKPPVLGWWFVTCQSHGSFLARAEPPSSSARPFRGFSTRKKGRPGEGEGATWEEFGWRDGIATFIDCIYILYIYNIYIYNIFFFWYSTFHEKSKYTGRFDILLEICT